MAENEEALWAAGYTKRGNYGYGNRKGGRPYRGNGRGSGFPSSQRGVKNLNPTGTDGNVLTCRLCGSYRHLVAKCPDSWENMSKVNIVEEENAILFTGYHKEEISQLGSDARNCAILDSACSSTVCGKTWIQTYMDSLNDDDRSKVVHQTGHRVFKFGGGTKLRSEGEYELPVCIVGKNVTVKTDVVDSDIPLLLSRSAMKKAGVKMDLENDTAVILGEEVALNITSSGHYCIPIDKTETIQVEEVNTVKIEVQGPEKRMLTLLKLHRQFAHPPKKRLVALLKDAGAWKDEFNDDLCEIEQKCELCKVYAKTPVRPVVALPMARNFNEKVAMDLKQYKGRWILHMIDMWSRYTVSMFISHKKPSNVIDALMKNWVGVFGVMGSLMTDNGGEFNSDETREITSILNIRVCTTAGMSPFQNGLCERVHAITDMMLLKLEAENPNIELETLLSWANMAKNSLQMWNGFSSHQLVFGKNPNLPNIMQAELPALGGNTTSEVFFKHMNALHETRKAYMKTEADERIRHALRSKVRAAEQVFKHGDIVFYKREGKERWLGPGKVMFQDSKVVFARHGGVFVRVSPNRLCKVNGETTQKLDTVQESGDKYDKKASETGQYENNESKNVSETVNDGLKSQGRDVVDQQGQGFQGRDIVDGQGQGHNVVVRQGRDVISEQSQGQHVQDQGHIVPNQCIEYKLPGSHDWTSAKVLSRAGKATGNNKMWYNVQDDISNEMKRVDLSRVEWKLTGEQNGEETFNTEDDDKSSELAKQAELHKLREFETYTEGQVTISTRWVIMKKDGNTRARLVARGFEEQSFIPKDSPTVGKGAMRIFLTVSASKKWKVKTTDIKSAFLQGKELNRDVFIKPPKESDTEMGFIWKLKHGLYGLKGGARQFYMSVKDELDKLGCKQSKSCSVHTYERRTS